MEEVHDNVQSSKQIVNGRLLYLSNKFKQNYTSENLHEYKKLKIKFINLLKKTKYYFVKVDKK